MVSGPCPSAPGFGYIIIPHPHCATFRNFGQYHTISYFPETHIQDPIEKNTICIWLGPDPSDLEVLAYLIWPGRGLLSFGQALNTHQSSRIITLLSDTGGFTTEPPTAIAGDILRINKNPCILFIQWSANPEHILQEAQELCLQTRALQAVDNLLKFLESSAVPGDAVASQGLSEWYRLKFGELKTMSRSPGQYLFDPSKLVVGLITDLATTLAETNKLDVTSKNILIPLCFVRSWTTDISRRMEMDESLFVRFVGDA